jgi:hypothetical protein
VSPGAEAVANQQHASGRHFFRFLPHVHPDITQQKSHLIVKIPRFQSQENKQRFFCSDYTNLDFLSP